MNKQKTLSKLLCPSPGWAYVLSLIIWKCWKIKEKNLKNNILRGGLWRKKQNVRISSTNQIIKLETSKNNEAVLPPYTEHSFFVVLWGRDSVFMEVNIILFDDFDSLDAFGVADTLIDLLAELKRKYGIKNLIS